MAAMSRVSRRRFVVVALAAVLVGTGLPGCTDDECTCPPPGSGVTGITVTIRGVDGPLDGRVSVESDDGLQRSRTEARLDSSGTCAIALGAGVYELRCAGRAYQGSYYAGTLSNSRSDTIRVVDGEMTPIDIALGAVEVAVAVPATAEGTVLTARLAPLGVAGSHSGMERVAMGTGVTRLRFPAVAPGAYRLASEPPVEGLPDSIAVVALQTSSLSCSLREPARIRGSITGSWLEMGTDAPDVVAFDQDSVAVRKVEVRPDGSVEIVLWTPGPVCLAVEHPTNYFGETVRYWVGGKSFATAERFDPALGQEVTFSVIESGIAGAAGTTPEASLPPRVWLYREDGSAIGGADLAFDNGLFRFPGLRPGRYFLRFGQTTEWIAHWYKRADSLSEATPIVIEAEGQTVWLTGIETMPGATISGVLLDARGDPVVAARLSIDVPGVHASPDREGRFDLLHVPDGTFVIAAQLGYDAQRWYYPGTTDPDSAVAVVVRAHEDVTGLEFRIGE